MKSGMSPLSRLSANSFEILRGALGQRLQEILRARDGVAVEIEPYAQFVGLAEEEGLTIRRRIPLGPDLAQQCLNHGQQVAIGS